jgi:hypothetical protein
LLGIFLSSGKNPMAALGEENGPAIMNFGRAMDLFGRLEQTGVDWRSIECGLSEVSMTKALEASTGQGKRAKLH